MQATVEGSEGFGSSRPSRATSTLLPGSWALRWLRSRRRILWAFGVAFAGVWVASSVLGARTTTLARRLSRDGYALREPVRAVPAAGGTLLLARREGAPADVFWLDAPVDEGGRIPASARLYNLTRSSGADEGSLTVVGRHAFYVVHVGGSIAAVERLDFAGHSLPEEPGERLRHSLAHWQRTGRSAGIVRERYRFARPVEYARLSTSGGFLELDAGLAGRARIALADGSVQAEARLLERQPSAAAVPDWVPWLVDRARAVPWIGPEAIAWLEQRAFGVRDQLQRAYRTVQPADGAAEAARALAHGEPTGDLLPAPPDTPPVGEPSGFPPAALTPLLEPAVRGEGEWRAVQDDPFVRSWPGAGPLFYQTFLRGDAERPYNHTYLTLWDPRVLQLHVVSGVEEPVSATGATGTGTIPKDPQTLTRLVGAFNGGFQALHGEFGMMADGRVYLPPKPWAATVAVFEDGSVGMGSWPGPSGPRQLYDEERAVAEIPADMLSMRQNLTSLVEDGRVNPWERWWWGAAPSGSSEQTLTQRSAMCLRHDGLMLYAWGDFLEPDALGQVLAAAGCRRAMHLDMNAGHTGFEFYNVLAPDEPRASLERVRRFEFDAPLPSRPGYRLRARRAVTAMQMPLPRFIRVDPRDFFYLTVKPTLPGPPLPEDGAFETRGLPQSGYPAALARHVDGPVRVLRLDPRRLTPVPSQEEDVAPLVQLARVEQASASQTCVYVEEATLGPRASVGRAGTGAAPLACGPSLAERPSARAWAGVDAHGFVVYAESNAPELSPWLPWLERLGVERAVALTAGQRPGLYLEGRVWAPDGRHLLRRPEGTSTLDLYARPAAGARVLFEDTEPRPYRHWAFLQDQRVRYFRTAPPSARAPSEALAPAAAGPNPAEP